VDESKIFYDFSSSIFNYLRESSKNLSQKILDIYKIIISITPIVIGLGYFLLPQSPNSVTLFFFVASVLCFMAALLYGLSILPYSPVNLTDPELFYKKYFNEDFSDILEQLAVDISNDCEHLSRAMVDKNEKLKKLILIFGISLSSLFIAYTSIFIHC